MLQSDYGILFYPVFFTDIHHRVDSALSTLCIHLIEIIYQIWGILGKEIEKLIIFLIKYVNKLYLLFKLSNENSDDPKRLKMQSPIQYAKCGPMHEYVFSQTLAHADST